jgi:hypothetical protein
VKDAIEMRQESDQGAGAGGNARNCFSTIHRMDYRGIKSLTQVRQFGGILAFSGAEIERKSNVDGV